MKRASIAALVAAAFAAPVAAAPATFAEDLLSGAFAGFGDNLMLDREVILLAANDQADQWRKWSDDFSHELATNLTTMYGPRLGSNRVVKGAPYSAEVVTEMNQSLADGNVITHKTTAAVYRDGEGRTRQESGTESKRAAVYISDPVAGRSIVLMPDSKTAVVRPRAFANPASLAHEHVSRNKQVMKFGPTEVRIEDGKVFIDGKEVTDGRIELKTKSGKDVRIENGKVFIDGKDVATHVGPQRVEVKTIEDADGTKRQEIRVQVVRGGDEKVTTIPLPPVPPVPPVAAVPPVPPLPPMPGVHTLRFESTARLGKGVTTQLGAKDFDGVRAEGKSTVWTIPAGQIGNRNPINVTSETWYSPDLKVTVYSRYNDPRTGESIYRLANIRRGEPSPTLFSVPEGYAEKGRGRDKDKDKEKK
jgi:hypothetical protein